MTLADVLLREIAKHHGDVAPAHRHILEIAKMIAEKHKEQSETLSSIAAMYVKVARQAEAGNVVPIRSKSA